MRQCLIFFQLMVVLKIQFLQLVVIKEIFLILLSDKNLWLQIVILPLPLPQRVSWGVFKKNCTCM